MSQSYDTLFNRPNTSYNVISSFLPSSRFVFPWIIENLMPIGLTLLTGEPRSGKTSLALQLAFEISTGVPALNSRVASLHEDQQPYRTSRGLVFYLALNQSTLSLQELTSRLFSSRDVPTYPKLSLNNTYQPSTPEEGLLNFRTTLTTITSAKLLILDNLSACCRLFKCSERDLLDTLRRLAEECKASILVLHTCRRTSPLTEHVDNHLHLSRLPLFNYYRLETVSRHLKSATHLLHCPSDAINFRFATLSEAAALHTLNAHKILSPERLAVLHLLRASDQPLTPLQIASTLDLDYDCTRQILSQMVKANLLNTTQRGHYIIHPFILPLLPSLLDHAPLIPQFSLANLPPDDSPDPETQITHNPSETTTAHNPPATPNTPIAHNGIATQPITAHNSVTPPQTTHHPPTTPNTPIAHNGNIPDTPIAHNFLAPNNQPNLQNHNRSQ